MPITRAIGYSCARRASVNSKWSLKVVGYTKFCGPDAGSCSNIQDIMKGGRKRSNVQCTV